MKTVLKNRNVIALIITGLVVMLLAASGVIADSPPGISDVQPKINYQGQLTDSTGNPLSGTYDMEFQFWNSATLGSQVGSTISKNNVVVTNGLFNVKLDVNQSHFNGQGLWLQIRVRESGGSWDPWMTPRQEILSVPYALSLVPGAQIAGSLNDSTLNVRNNGTGAGVIGSGSSGHGVNATSAGGAQAGAALWAENTNTSNGIAIWAQSDSFDSTLVIGNAGAGDLIKGFGGDGGEDEFRVSNNGKIESKADSYVFISGNQFIKDESAESTTWDCQSNGSVQIRRGGTAGFKDIYIPITLPGVLYGQPVKIEEITVYYRCQDGTKNYIGMTQLLKQTDADSAAIIVSDTTDRKSNTATSYTLNLTANNTLSSDQGILGLYMMLEFDDDINYIQIGGVRLRLGHHSLY